MCQATKAAVVIASVPKDEMPSFLDAPHSQPRKKPSSVMIATTKVAKVITAMLAAVLVASNCERSIAPRGGRERAQRPYN